MPMRPLRPFRLQWPDDLSRFGGNYTQRRAHTGCNFGQQSFLLFGHSYPPQRSTRACSYAEAGRPKMKYGATPRLAIQGALVSEAC